MEEGFISLSEERVYVPPEKSAFKDICYGSIAGIVSKLFEHPFDLVKVRLQSQPLDRPLKFKGPVDCMVQTFKGEGVRGLWRGVSMPVGGAMAENATLFVVYNQSQAFLRKMSPPPSTLASEAPPISLGQLSLSAAIAGACASFVLTPVELVKCKMQVQNIVAGDLLLAAAGVATSSSSSSIALNSGGTNMRISPAKPPPPLPTLPPPGPVSITRSILAQDGIRGLWLGQTGTIIRETGGSAAWFTTFELLTRYFIQRRVNRGEFSKVDGQSRVTKSDLSAIELMTGGASAGVIYNCILFPADCIKSTIQTEDELRGLNNSTKGTRPKPNGTATLGRRTFLQVGKDIYKARGIRGLYSGCGVTALRAAPSSALIFYIYSRLEGIFG